MEWTKIKPKHFIYTDYTLANKGCLITLLCLTAHLEKMPTFREMSKVCHKKAITKLEEVVKLSGSSLEVLLNKVLEDCEKVEHKKGISRETSKRYRESSKKSDTSHDTTDKIRLDKIRLDKTHIVAKGVEDIVTDFNLVMGKNIGRSKKDKEFIQARLNEGFTIEEFKVVHRKMLQIWGNDEKMYKFLRPSTLYSNKFESYLNMTNPQTKLTESGIKAFQIGQEWLKNKKERENAR